MAELLTTCGSNASLGIFLLVFTASLSLFMVFTIS